MVSSSPSQAHARENVAAQDKCILVIPDGDHNTLMMEGMAEYFKAIEELVSGR